MPKKYGTAAQKQAAYRARCAAQRQEELASKGIPKVPSMPGYRRWDVMRRHALCLMEQVACEMESYYEEKSERWQDSERGEVFAEVMESIADIAATLKEISSL